MVCNNYRDGFEKDFSLKIYLLRDSSNQAMGLHEPSHGLTTIAFTAVGQQGASEKCATLKTGRRKAKVC